MRFKTAPGGPISRKFHVVVLVDENANQGEAADVASTLFLAECVSELRASPWVASANVAPRVTPSADVLLRLVWMPAGYPALRKEYYRFLVQAWLPDGTLLDAHAWNNQINRAQIRKADREHRSGLRVAAAEATHRTEHILADLAATGDSHVLAARIAAAKSAELARVPVDTEQQAAEFLWNRYFAICAQKREPAQWYADVFVVAATDQETSKAMGIGGSAEHFKLSGRSLLCLQVTDSELQGLGLAGEHLRTKLPARFSLSSALPLEVEARMPLSVIPAALRAAGDGVVAGVYSSMRIRRLSSPAPPPAHGELVERLGAKEREGLLAPFTEPYLQFARKMAPAHNEYLAEVIKIEVARREAENRAAEAREEAHEAERAATFRGIANALGAAAQNMRSGSASTLNIQQAANQSYQEMADARERYEVANAMSKDVAAAAKEANSTLSAGFTDATQSSSISFEGEMVRLTGTIQERMSQFHSLRRKKLAALPMASSR